MPSTDSGSDTIQGDAIKVFVRVRPPETYSSCDLGNQLCLSVSDCKKAVIMQCKPEPKIYTYDYVADGSATQECMFNTIGKSIIESCINGYNGTIFAYGQTGSGKTFTMLGTSEEGDNFQHDLRGIIPRSFEYLFSIIHREQELHGAGKEFLLKCSFLEIYQEHIYDLLEPSSQNLHLRENMKKGVFVDGLVEHSVTNALEAYQVLNSGWMNRRVASTSMNRESSRSHAVFTIQIESKETKDGVQNIKSCQLNLVDLAGSERQKDTQAEGKRLKEGCSINMSLSILGNVIMSLVDIGHGKKRHVPYRDSRLTFLLRDSLGGNAKTQIIACIHPGARCFGETLSTLDFAKRAKMIKNKAVINEDMKGNVASLQAEIKNLKEKLSQYQAGNIPTEIGKADASNTRMGAEWREKFIRAMIYKEKVDSEKNLLLEKIENLNSICGQKDKFVQSQKMIIKFRDSSIARMEKSIMQSCDEKLLGRLDDMKKEIVSLNSMIEHHPQVMKYATDIQCLKTENKQLQNHLQTTSNLLLDSRKLEELEKNYRDLLSADSDKKNCATPSMMPSGADNISIATLEKYKSKFEKQQEEISNLQKEMAEWKEKTEKKEMALNSELESYKRSNAELQMVLETNQLKSKMEKEAMNDKHLQTVMTITTPKKAKYHLRNRIVTSSSTCSTPTFDSPLLQEEVRKSIFDEEEPELMKEQTQEALMEEIKQLQEQSASLSRQVSDFETEAIKLRQHISKVDHQNGYLTEKLEQERKEYKAEKEENLQELKNLKTELEQIKENSRMFESEKNDLKVLLNSADKELMETKSKLRNNLEDKQDIENRLMQIDLELSKITKEYEEVRKERDFLEDDNKTYKATAIFNEDLNKELTEKLFQLSNALDQSKSQQEKLEYELMQEKDKSKEMIEELAAEGEAKEKNVLELINAKCQLERALEESETYGSELQSKLHKMESKNSSQQKTIDENKDAISSFMTKIESLKCKVQEAEEKAETLSQENAALKSDLASKAIEVEELTIQNEQLETKMSNEVNKLGVQVSILQDELDGRDEVMRSFQSESSRQEQEMSELTSKLSQKEIELEQTKAVLSHQQAEMETSRSEFLEKISRLQEQQSRVPEELELVLDDRMEEITQLKSNQLLLYNKIEEYENLWKEKNREAADLKNILAQKENVEEELSVLKHKYDTEKWESQNKTVQLQDRIDELQHRLSECLEELASKSSDLQGFNSVQDQLQIRLSETENEKRLVEENLTVISAETERLRDVIRNHHTYSERMETENSELKKAVQDMKEKINLLQEENTKLASHQNMKQKIHYITKLKNEINSLQEQLQEKSSLIEELRRQNGVLHVQPRALIEANRSLLCDSEDDQTPSKKSKYKH